MSVYIRDLCKSFGEKKVLNHLNLTLEDGKIYCLMGPSGMGKTTLLRIIMNLEKKDSGTITGIDPETEISSMFQEDRILPMLSAIDNVNMMYEKKRPVKELKEDLSTILPRKCLRQPVCELSGGMKRRVSLARSMHFQGKMIILDEPFTGLDHATKEEVISYILKNRRNRILLVATHGLDDAELLGAQVIRLEKCQELTLEMRQALPKEEKEDTPAFAGGELIGSLRRLYTSGQNIRLLDGIEENSWENMARLLDGHIENYKAGEKLWQIGEVRSEFSVVFKGMVAAYTEDLKGRDVLVAKFGQGRCFGEMLPISREPSPVKVLAAEDSRVLFFPVEKFREKPATMEEAELKMQLSWNLTCEMVDKLKFLSAKVSITSETTVHQKVLHYLLSLPEDEEGWRTMFDLQKDTAQYLMVSSETLSKEFSDMEKKGLVQREDNKIKLLRPEAFGLDRKERI